MKKKSQQKNNYSKPKNNNIKSLKLSTGISLKSQTENNKLLQKAFTSSLKLFYKKFVKKRNNKKSYLTKKDPKPSISYECECIYDNEKTIQVDNVTDEEFYDDQSTLYTDDIYNSFQVFLSKKTINLIGRNENTYPLLNINLGETIRGSLPNLLQEAVTWKLLYSLDQHGASLTTLYNNIKSHGPCIMVIKTCDDEIFGAFLSEAFDSSNKGFYGTPECFLWKADQYQFKTFKATNINQYLMLADKVFFCYGRW